MKKKNSRPKLMEPNCRDPTCVHACVKRSHNFSLSLTGSCRLFEHVEENFSPHYLVVQQIMVQDYSPRTFLNYWHCTTGKHPVDAEHKQRGAVRRTKSACVQKACCFSLVNCVCVRGFCTIFHVRLPFQLSVLPGKPQKRGILAMLLWNS